MGETISVRLGKDLEKDLVVVERKWHADRSEVIRRLLASAIKEWKINNSLEKLAAHKISLSKAAEESEISLWEMIDIVKEKKIDWVGLTTEDIERDLEIVKNLSKR
ncbi:MAG: UPF0175 family protein [Nanoarchaeota archaeon]|nr:UPF0175 family protein [Nanoarchaeota archaeon]